MRESGVVVVGDGDAGVGEAVGVGDVLVVEDVDAGGQYRRRRQVPEVGGVHRRGVGVVAI